MRIKVNYNELYNVLGYVNTVLSNKTVDEKMKNVIFLVDKENVTLVGYSALTFSRTKLESVEVEGVEDTYQFQVKYGDLNGIVGSYSNLSKTKVEDIEFEDSNNRIKMSVHEEAIDPADERLAQVSRFMLDNVPILESIKKEITNEFPEDVDTVFSGDLLLYLDSLFPLMSNDSVSKFNFGDEYVFVLSSYISSFFVNKLPDSFKGVTLGYSSINFLRKLCTDAESINVQKVDRYLCIQSGLTEAFLKYQTVKIKTEPYVKRMSKDNGIVLDRLYLKDVLKRMLVFSQDGTAQMTDLGLEVSNQGFTQIVPVNNRKGDVDNLKFRMSTSVLMKTIIGDDSVFSGDLFLYFVKIGANGYMIYVKDATGAWFSTIQVRV